MKLHFVLFDSIKYKELHWKLPNTRETDTVVPSLFNAENLKKTEITVCNRHIMKTPGFCPTIEDITKFSLKAL